MKQLEGQITFDDLMKEEKTLTEHFADFLEKEKYDENDGYCIELYNENIFLPLFFKSYKFYSGFLFLFAQENRNTMTTMILQDRFKEILGFREYLNERGIEL